MNRLDFFGTFGIKEKSTKMIPSYPVVSLLTPPKFVLIRIVIYILFFKFD